MVEKKLTLEDLLDRARQRDNNKIQIREYFSEELGGNIAVTKMFKATKTPIINKPIYSIGDIGKLNAEDIIESKTGRSRNNKTRRKSGTYAIQ